MLSYSRVLVVRNENRAQTLVMLILEYNSSKLAKRNFCQQRGISEKSFYYWLRKLRSHRAETTGPQLIQLDSVPIQNYMLQAQYRDTDLKRPTDVDICCCHFAPFYSIIIIDLSKVRNYYIACGNTDLYLRIDVLAAVVTQQ